MGLAGCATIPTVETAKVSNVCVPWRSIKYVKADADTTKVQIRIHNQTGRNLRCWR